MVGVDVVLDRAMEEASARELLMAFANKNLERYKVPRIIRFVPQISTNLVGKKTRFG